MVQYCRFLNHVQTPLWAANLQELLQENLRLEFKALKYKYKSTARMHENIKLQF